MSSNTSLPTLPLMPSKSQAILAISSGTTTKSPINIGMKIAIAALLNSGAVILAVPEAQAQIVYYPYVGATITQNGGTIINGGTFQTALASNPNRHGCLIQNTSSHAMSVYVGTLAAATLLNSLQVSPSGGTYSCNNGPFIATGDINVTTSTTSDPYVVQSW